MALDERIEVVRAEYGLQKDDFWQIPQNKQWVCKHSALEIVAVKAEIVFDMPMIINNDPVALNTSMIVRGTMGERSEWATGETNATNYSVKGKQPAYPWAMSEKRAKDRVILKLVGIHGLVYSEDEISNAPAPKQEEKPVINADTVYEDSLALIRTSKTLKDLQLAWIGIKQDALSSDEMQVITHEKDKRKSELSQPQSNLDAVESGAIQ